MEGYNSRLWPCILSRTAEGEKNTTGDFLPIILTTRINSNIFLHFLNPGGDPLMIFSHAEKIRSINLKMFGHLSPLTD